MNLYCEIDRSIDRVTYTVHQFFHIKRVGREICLRYGIK